MADELLSDLRRVGDDELYRRLLLHHHSPPSPEPLVDYVYRADLWAMADAAIRGEIARRRAPPPAWWPVRARATRRTGRLVIAAVVYLGLLVLLAVLAAAVGRNHG